MQWNLLHFRCRIQDILPYILKVKGTQAQKTISNYKKTLVNIFLVQG